MPKDLVFDIASTIVSVSSFVAGFTYNDAFFVIAVPFLLVGFPATWILNRREKKEGQNN